MDEGLKQDEAMKHPRIDDEKIIDRYLAGRLAGVDEELFEEHLFECAECLEQVQAGEELRRGLRAVAAEDAARATLSLGLLAWLRSRRPSQLAGALSLAMALVVLPALLLRQQTELNRLRSAPPPTAEPGLTEPLGNLLAVSLGVVRDASEIVKIRPKADTDALLLSLELPAVNASRYRATLLNETSEVLWQGEDLEPNLYDALLIALPSSYLAPGVYRITLEGLPAAGAEEAGAEIAEAGLAEDFEFRVLPGE